MAIDWVQVQCEVTTLWRHSVQIGPLPKAHTSSIRSYEVVFNHLSIYYSSNTRLKCRLDTELTTRKCASIAPIYRGAVGIIIWGLDVCSLPIFRYHVVLLPLSTLYLSTTSRSRDKNKEDKDAWKAGLWTLDCRSENLLRMVQRTLLCKRGHWMHDHEHWLGVVYNRYSVSIHDSGYGCEISVDQISQIEWCDSPFCLIMTTRACIHQRGYHISIS